MSRSLRCLIIDGDQATRHDLVTLMGSHPEISVLAAVGTVAAAIPLCLSLDPDLIFLDNSLKEVEKLAALPARLARRLIVTLAHDEKGASAAWDNQSIDFLLKPYSQQRLSLTISKLRIHIEGSTALATAVHQLKALKDESFKVAGRCSPFLVKMVQVSAIQAEGDYTLITLEHGVTHLVRRTLVAWSESLANSTFYRLDRSILINLAHVLSYHRISRDKARLELKGFKEPIFLGRRAILRLHQEWKVRPSPF